MFVIFGISIAVFLVATTAKEWAIDDRTQASVLIGVGSQFKSDDKVVIGVGQNGVGNFGEVYDSASDSWAKSANIEMMMLMDAAMTQSGNMLVTGMGNAISSDGGKTFAKDPNLLGVSQAAYSFGSDGGNLGVVGTMTLKGAKKQTDGVAWTSDSGKTWTLSASVPEGMPRYGAFPTDNIWFVSQGMWNTEEDSESEEGRYHSLSAHVKKDKKNGGVKFTQPSRKWPKTLKDDVNATGWWGAVSKTEDGGKTWKQVLRTDESDYIYFNQISCGSADNCIVVGEGSMPDGTDLTVVYTTFDGGNSWTKVVPSSNDVSMLAAKFTGPNEAWVGGLIPDGRNVVGQFYKTTDGGKSFKLEQGLTNCFPMDIDFGVELGAAACISSSGSSATVAFYK